MEKVFEDVEMMVNEPKRQEAIQKRYARKEARKQWKMANHSIAFALACILLDVLANAGLLASWIAIPGSLIAIICSAFCFGRWYEHGKWKGWKKWR